MKIQAGFMVGTCLLITRCEEEYERGLISEEEIESARMRADGLKKT